MRKEDPELHELSAEGAEIARRHLRILVILGCLVSDWGAAASHMAFAQVAFSPFYAQSMPLWGDVWHFVAGFRYVPMFMLMAAACGLRWRYWAAFAGLNWAGWQVLKILHGKDWGWGVWERWL